jgi:Lar family restriction alleviation protein
MKEKLKHCPFCGGNAERFNYMREGILWSEIQCCECGAEITRGDKRDPRKIAIAAWNTRAERR